MKHIILFYVLYLIGGMLQQGGNALKGKAHVIDGENTARPMKTERKKVTDSLQENESAEEADTSGGITLYFY